MLPLGRGECISLAKSSEEGPRARKRKAALAQASCMLFLKVSIPLVHAACSKIADINGNWATREDAESRVHFRSQIIRKNRGSCLEAVHLLPHQVVGSGVARQRAERSFRLRILTLPEIEGSLYPCYKTQVPTGGGRKPHHSSRQETECQGGRRAQQFL